MFVVGTSIHTRMRAMWSVRPTPSGEPLVNTCVCTLSGVNTLRLLPTAINQPLLLTLLLLLPPLSQPATSYNSPP